MNQQGNEITHWVSVAFGVFYGITFEQWISLGVLLVAVITLLMNSHYKRKHYELAEKQFQFNQKRANAQRGSNDG